MKKLYIAPTFYFKELKYAHLLVDSNPGDTGTNDNTGNQSTDRPSYENYDGQGTAKGGFISFGFDE